MSRHLDPRGDVPRYKSHIKLGALQGICRLRGEQINLYLYWQSNPYSSIVHPVI